MLVKLAWPEAVYLEGSLWAVPDIRVVASKFGSCIVLGPLFFMQLDCDEQCAILVHESYHSYWQQFSRGVIRILAPCFLRWVTHCQEFAADMYAAKAGHAEMLASALYKLDPYDRASSDYPSTSERIRRLNETTK